MSDQAVGCVFDEGLCAAEGEFDGGGGEGFVGGAEGGEAGGCDGDGGAEDEDVGGEGCEGCRGGHLGFVLGRGLSCFC